MIGDNYDDPVLEAKWLAEQRTNIQRYLERESVLHGNVAPEPEWFLAPCISVWTVESLKIPGAPGWWAISGDLPTDYLIAADATTARGALREFARRWAEVSACMLRGEEHPTVKIGTEGNRRELGDLLQRRAEIIQQWADDDTMWEPP